MRLSASTEVTAVDMGPFLAALPMVLAQWRALTFRDGVVRHPVTGAAHHGLRVVDGKHPHPGVVYRLVIREEDEPAPGGVTWHTFAVALGTDDARRTTFSVHEAETDTRVRVDLTDPARPGPIDVAADVTDFGGTSSFLRGVVEILLRAELGSGVPHLVTSVRHRHARAHAELVFAVLRGGRWSVTADVDARGAGWIRPLVGAIAPFLKPAARRGLAEVLDGLPPAFDRLSRELATRYPSPPDPHTLAEQIMADLITEIPVNLPPTANV
jgi:hypothetical protein